MHLSDNYVAVNNNYYILFREFLFYLFFVQLKLVFLQFLILDVIFAQTPQNIDHINRL